MSDKTIKCLVWDLDDTLWLGTLLEGGVKTLAPGVRQVIEGLDKRGILQSIASRNFHDQAFGFLEELGLAKYFLYPQINFGPKSESVKIIATKLNIGLDTFAFIDDQAFERAEVESVMPEVMTLKAEEVSSLIEQPRFKPRFITKDSARRRAMYQTDQIRDEAEEKFQGPSEAFLANLQLKFTVDQVGPGDLERAVDLTERTHQLNATGLTFSHDDLAALLESPDHLLLINSLSDRFGDYGKIGLSLLDKSGEHWVLKLLLMSCRVMSRGVGSAMLNILINYALTQGRILYADFVDTKRNRMMYVTYCFAGFEEVERVGDQILLRRPSKEPSTLPTYLQVDYSVPDLKF